MIKSKSHTIRKMATLSLLLFVNTIQTQTNAKNIEGLSSYFAGCQFMVEWPSRQNEEDEYNLDLIQIKFLQSGDVYAIWKDGRKLHGTWSSDAPDDVCIGWDNGTLKQGCGHISLVETPDSEAESNKSSEHQVAFPGPLTCEK